MYSITQSDLLGNSAERDVHRECTGRVEARKYLKKSCCHRIERPVANFLATFIWRRPLNNTALATTTHRKPESVSDGTSTQVVAQMINKCRIKIVQKELYNVRDPPWMRDWKREREKTVAIKIVFVICSIDLYYNSLPRTVPRVNLLGSILLTFVWLSFKPILSVV